MRQLRDTRALTGVLLAVAIFGVAYIVLMPPGLPYDEPSHWLNVRFLLDHHRLPVVGEDGVTYEAQMGPMEYLLGALVAAPFGSVKTGFYAVRAFDLLQLVALTVVVWRLISRALPGRPHAAILAAAVVGLNPMLLAMATSVQNDVLSLLLAGVALDVATSSSLSIRRAVGVGVLVGLALLTKITVWPVGLVLAGWMLWRSGVLMTVAYGLAAAAVSGWWFVRNLHLYGDVTGKAGVDAAGYAFPPLGVQPGHIAREVVTTLWLPVEYVRNTVTAPAAIELLVFVLMACGVAGLVVVLRWASRVAWLLLAVGLVSFVGWVILTVWVQAVSFRIAFPVVFAWSMAVGGVAATRWGRWAAAGVLMAMLALSGWFLSQVAPLGDRGLLPLAVR